MFNESQKSSFLITIGGDTQRKIATTTLDLIEPFESSQGKDICEFSSEELTPIVDKISSLGAGKNSTRMKVVRQYLNWCVINGIPNARNELSNVEIKFVDQYKRKMVSGPGHLQNCLDYYFDPENYETIDNIYRCYLWLSFSGVEIEDLQVITAENINLAERTIKIQDSSYEIYKESIPCLKNCMQLDYFMYHHPGYNEEFVERKRMPGKLLLRGIKSVMNESKFRTSLSIKMGEAKDPNVPRLTTKSVYMSGIFYRQYEIDRALGSMGAFQGDMCDMFYDSIVNKRHRKKMSEETNRHEAWVYYNNYEKWKLSFMI